MILSVNQVNQGRGSDARVGSKSLRTHTVVFRVMTSSPYDDGYVAMTAFGIPVPGQRHPTDPYAYAVGCKPAIEGKGKMSWLVTVDYSTERQRSENPFSDPALIEWTTDTSQEVFAYDKDGNPILNTAGDRYEEALKDDVSHWVVSIAKNLPYMPQWIDDYRDAVNSDDVYIDGLPVAAGSAKIKSIKVSKWQTRGDYQFRELSMSIKIKDTWVKYLVENGLMAVNPADNTQRVHVSAGKVLLTKPQLLDANGYQIFNPGPTKLLVRKSDGTVLVDPGGTPTCVTTAWDLRNQQPFSALPLN